MKNRSFLLVPLLTLTAGLGSYASATNQPQPSETLPATEEAEAAKPPTPVEAFSWLKEHFPLLKAGNDSGVGLMRRGYISEDQFDPEMLAPLQQTGIGRDMPTEGAPPKMHGTIEVVWYISHEDPSQKCAVLLQPSKPNEELNRQERSALENWKHLAPDYPLTADCKASAPDPQADLGYQPSFRGPSYADQSLSCAQFANGQKDSLTVTARTTVALSLRYNADYKPNARGGRIAAGVSRRTVVGLLSVINARDFPYLQYMPNGFTVDRPENFSLASYVIDEPENGLYCVALVAQQGDKEWSSVKAQTHQGETPFWGRGGKKWNPNETLREMGAEFGRSLILQDVAP